MALILFDFDGVLADTLDDMIKFAQETCDELGVNHIVTPDDLNSLDTMSLAEYGRQLEVPDYLVDEFVSQTLKRFIEKKTPPNIFSGMDQVVKKLSMNNVIAIITGNTTGTVRNFLVEHGMDGRVCAIFGVDTPGSKPEKISSARSLFAKDGDNVFMVGDATSDIRAAKETSIKSIAVSWGHQSAEKLTYASPDYLVHSPRELFETIIKVESRQYAPVNLSYNRENSFGLIFSETRKEFTMSARVEIRNSTARIILSGDLDYSTQNDIHSAIEEGLQADGVLQIEIDLAAASFMDSSVIRALLTLQKEASKSGKPMTIVNTNEIMREIFIIGGFDRIFNIR